MSGVTLSPPTRTLPGDLRDRDPAAAADLAEETGIGSAARASGPAKRGPPLPVQFPRRYSTRVRHPLVPHVCDLRALHPWFPRYVIFVLFLGSGVVVLII